MKAEIDVFEEREEDQFPPLSKEAEMMVNKAFSGFSSNEVLVNFFGRNITRYDIKTLFGTTWLNDEVINAYMDLIVERGKKEEYPSVYAFNTIFYNKITTGGGHAAVKLWTRKVDIFSHQYLLIPVHLHDHWCIMIVNFKEKSISYYDSMLHPNMPALQAMKNYLIAEKQDKKQETLDMSDWKLLSPREIPHQENSFDCGVFASMFAETITRQKPIKFTQSHMPYFRKRMAYEIMSLKLML